MIREAPVSVGMGVSLWYLQCNVLVETKERGTDLAPPKRKEKKRKQKKKNTNGGVGGNKNQKKKKNVEKKKAEAECRLAELDLSARLSYEKSARQLVEVFQAREL